MISNTIIEVLNVSFDTIGFLVSLATLTKKPSKDGFF
jgi:hypothetical protein